MIVNLYVGKDLVRSVECDVLPRVGESIDLHPPVNDEQAFQVVSVVHHFEGDQIAHYAVVLR